MIDPFKKAKDGDRNAAADVVRAAFAHGRISQPDHDLRLQRIDQAQTIAELQAITRELPAVTTAAPVPQRPTDVLGATRAATPTAYGAARPEEGRRTFVGIIVAAIIAVVLLGVGLAGVLFVGTVGGVGSGGDSASSTQVERAVPDLTSAKGFDEFVAALRQKTGTTVVFDATVYPRYAVVEVPVDENGQRSYGWYYDGAWQKWTGKGTAQTERFDLADLDGPVVASVLRKAGKLVEEPTSTYVLVSSLGREAGTCFSAYATNDYGETAYVDATCAGKVVRRYVS
ncbi:hypothetical protein GCM10009623_26540 [Nocardioides aestuarii]|uniref:DUF1707 domain-containing protein n=1 Tax=Nocardioides aestuarii TaxID=252231 RepID=A0ABW4TMW1_9ACTN